MENYLLINNGHGYNVCDISKIKIPWDLSDETRFTEKKLCKHLEKSINMVDVIFARIETKDNVVTSWGMFGRTLSKQEKTIIKNEFMTKNSRIKNRKRLRFVFYGFT